MTAPAMTPQQERFSDERQRGLALYRELAVGDAGLLYFLGFEAAQLLFGACPGLLGFAARAVFYPPLFAECAGRPAIGRGVVLRQPNRITLGSGAIIDDYAVLDVRGSDAGIRCADRVAIGRFTTVAAKGGIIDLGSAVNIGSYCRIATQSRVSIGASTLVAAFCYIGPGNHQFGEVGEDGKPVPLIAAQMENKGGVKIGRYCWIGAHTTIVDGVSIGNNVIIGANSLVRDNVSDNCVVAGTPARIIKSL